MKNRTLGYSFIQSFFWMCYAAMMGFASMYLLQSETSVFPSIYPWETRKFMCISEFEQQ